MNKFHNSDTGYRDNAYLQDTINKPKFLKRGTEEFIIDKDEPEKVDHVLFLVHGIGSYCDIKFKPFEEVGELQN